LIHELRHYIAVPGRLEALLQRFRQHTFAVFQRLGFNVVACWEAADGSDEFWYIVAWRDEADMRRNWEILKADPEWLEIKKDTERDGPLVVRIDSTLLRPLEMA